MAAFNDNMFTLTKRETSVAQRTRAVDRLTAWGGTALYDVIIRGVQQLSKQPGRRVLVVFSDGDDRTSHATIHAVEQAVRANDATLFMVALGRGVKEAQLKSGIERLVELSGGRALFVERSDQLDRALRRDPRRAVEPVHPRLRIEEHVAQRRLARSKARDSRQQLQRARAPGLSRAGLVDDAPRLSSHSPRSCWRARSRSRRSSRPHRSRRRSPRPSFETKAEIVLVDVNVVDRDAKPVPTLTAADFELEVNGQPRTIDSVQFISTTPTNTTAATPRETAYTSNETATTGRLLLFVVDEGSLRVGANRTVLRTRAIAVRSAGARRPGRPGPAAERRRRRRVHRRSQAHHRRA